jgi:hypothetical protein
MVEHDRSHRAVDFDQQDVRRVGRALARSFHSADAFDTYMGFTSGGPDYLAVIERGQMRTDPHEHAMRSPARDTEVARQETSADAFARVGDVKHRIKPQLDGYA